MTAHQILTSAAILADSAAPYLARIRAAAPLIPAPDCTAAAVDQQGRIYYNPSWIAAHTPCQVAYVLIHEMQHLLRDHAARRAARGAEPGQWNRAADLEINSEKWPGTQCPVEALTPAGEGHPAGLLAEQYYTLEQQRRQPQPGQQGQPQPGGQPGQDGQQQPGGQPGQPGQPGQQQPGGQPQPNGQPGQQQPQPGHQAAAPRAQEPGADAPGGSAADGVTRSYERPADDAEAPGLDQWELDALRHDAAAALSGGGAAGNAALVFDVITGRRPRWTARLHAAISNGARAAGYTTATYSRARRRGTIYQPRTTGTRARIAAVLDTSGSMAASIGTAAGAILHAAATCGPVDIVYCDTEPHVQRNVSRAQQIKPIGGGNTELAPGIRKAEELKPDIILIVTDGAFRWQRTPPRCRRCIILLTEPDGRRPSWGDVITL